MKDLTMEIYIDKFFLFPYRFINYLDQSQWELFSDSALYLVMQTDKCRIVDFDFNEGILNIRYENHRTQHTHVIKGINLFELLGIAVPECYMHITVSSTSDLLEVDILPEGVEYLQKQGIVFADLDIQPTKIPLQVLLQLSHHNSKNPMNCELLYVGESGNGNSRLFNHRTIQEISRNTVDANVDLIIMLLHPTSKLYRASSFGNRLEVVTGNHNWIESNEVSQAIDNITLRKVAEAMLINRFKPPYNKTHKNKPPNKNQKTYSVLATSGIHKLQLSMTLYHQEDRYLLNISTKAQSTEGNGCIILSCSLEELQQAGESHIDFTPFNYYPYN